MRHGDGDAADDLRDADGETVKRVALALLVILYVVIGIRVGKWAQRNEIRMCIDFFRANGTPDDAWCLAYYNHEFLPYIPVWPVWGVAEFVRVHYHVKGMP